VVNVHHLADQIERHLRVASSRVSIADERSELPGTGGGVIKALPLLGDGPFFHVIPTPSDRWREAQSRPVADAFDLVRMECCRWSRPPPPASAIPGAATSRCDRRPADAPRRREVVPFVMPARRSTRRRSSPARRPAPPSIADVRPRTDAGRLYGLRLEGVWMHVGTPEAIKAAEERSVSVARARAALSASGRNSMDAAAHRQDAAPTLLVDRPGLN
jgi:MurNAc alpha-1-phosphate uridylyltransferase